MSQVLTHLSLEIVLLSIRFMFCFITIFSLHDSNMIVTGRTKSVDADSYTAAEEVVNDTTTVSAATPILYYFPRRYFNSTRWPCLAKWPKEKKILNYKL